MINKCVQTELWSTVYLLVVALAYYTSLTNNKTNFVNSVKLTLFNKSTNLKAENQLCTCKGLNYSCFFNINVCKILKS